MRVRFFRDRMTDSVGGSDGYDIRKSDKFESQRLLQYTLMKRCGITESDLEDISIVKSKLRNFSIDEIIK